MKSCGLQTNYLQASNFQLVLPRFPHVQYYSTDFVLPSILLPAARAATPYVDMKFAGDKPIFEPLSFKFIVDEKMSNYLEVFNWLTKIGYATSHSDYKNYTNKSNEQPLGEQDAKLIILTNKGNPIKVITFYDAIPTSLSQIQFSSQLPDVVYPSSTITMEYTHFDINDIQQ